MTAVLSDRQQREQAIDPENSFIVQAPAGSGKTGLLVRRFLKLLARVSRPEEILAITFTRKATAEMAERILSALATASEPDRDVNKVPDDQREIFDLAQSALTRDREFGWNLVSSPSRLRIKTIDSLCYELVRNMPWSSRFGAAPDTVEDNQAEEFYREAASRTLNLIEETNQRGEHVSTVLSLVNVQFSRARELLAQMLKKRDLWLRGVDIDDRKAFEDMWARVVTDELTVILESIPMAMRDELLSLAEFAAKNLSVQGIDHELILCLDTNNWMQARPEYLPCLRGLTKILFSNDGSLRKLVNVNTGFPPGCAEKTRMKALLDELALDTELAGNLARINLLPDPGFTDQQWHILEALLHVLPVAAAQLQLLFSENNAADYAEITQRAEMALGPETAPTDLSLMMDHRLSHLLMDEVQDTSRAHMDIIASLVRGWTQGDGRTAFFVGDPMQSIYRFREADVTGFIRLQQQGIGDLPLQSLVLETNFRSDAALVGWFNDTFASVFPDTSDLVHAAVEYAPGTSLHPAAGESGVNIVSVLEGDEEDQADLLCEQLMATLDSHPGYSIGILGRTRNHLRSVARSLRKHHLPFQAIELESLDSDPAIQDLTALTRALLHPADRTAWMSILRGPWCGLSLADATLLAGDDFQTPVPALIDKALETKSISEIGAARVAAVLERLSTPLSRRGRAPLRELVEAAWIRLGGPATVEKKQLDDCEAFLDMLEDLEQRDIPVTDQSLAEASQRLWSGYESDANIQLLSIHKSKGLEFDAVFIPALDRGSGNNRTELLNWARTGSDNSLLAATLSPSEEDNDVFNRYLRDLEKLRQRNEDCRLLYVACTRARIQLNLYANLKINQNGEVSEPANGTLLRLLWPAIGHRFVENARDPVQCDDQPSDDKDKWLTRIPRDWRPPVVPQGIHDLRADSPIEEKSREEIEFSWAGETVRIAGIAVHQILQTLPVGLQGLNAADVERMTAAVYPLLVENGLSGDQVHTAQQYVKQALVNILDDQRAQWIFSDAHSSVRTEWPLSGVIGGERISIVIDRTFIDSNGIQWIIDFKSSRHESGRLDEFLEREKQRYEEQLHTYARFLRQFHSGRIRLGLYFPLLKGWCEWEAPSES